MTPPPPNLKLGQRDLFNDSFFSFLRRKDKSQPQPAPAPAAPHSQDSQVSIPIENGHGHAHPRPEESIGEKKAILQEGHRILDTTKDLLERNYHFFRKETLKRLRKEAAKLTKSAPSKSKLMKKTFRDISNFQESAKVLYQEVDNIIREMDHNNGGYPGHELTRVQEQTARPGSESPPPLPKKPPSPKVTFTTDMKQDPNSHLSRQQSGRRGYELRDPPVTLTRDESTKPISSSRHRERETEMTRGPSQKDLARTKTYDRDERRDGDQYKHRDDDYYRSHPRRHASERHRDDSRDNYRDRDHYRRDYYSSRSGRYDDRDRDKDKDRDTNKEKGKDRDKEHRDAYRDHRRDDRYRERDKEKYRERDRGEEAKRGESSASDQPQRVVHPDIPLSATASGGGHGVPVAPTYVDFPRDEEGRRRREREKEKERENYYREREHRDRDRGEDRDRDRYKDRDRDRKRDDEYYRSRDKYKSRRHEDEYASRPGRHRDKDKDRDRERPRERGRDGERDKVRERERERERDQGKARHQPSGESPPLTPIDPAGSKFQEVFSPPEHVVGVLPPPSEAA